MELRLNTKTITSYKSLMMVLRRAIVANWSGISFTSAAPKVSPTESVSTPIVSYSLESKEPGELKNAKEIKPRLRETIRVEDIMDGDMIVSEGGTMDVWGQVFDYVIAFNVYGSNEEEADDAADKFQQFMFKHTGYLKKLGVNELLFLSMRNNVEERTTANLACRNIRYFIRLDEIVGMKMPTIESIEVEEPTVVDTLERMLEFYVPDTKLAADEFIETKLNND